MSGWLVPLSGGAAPIALDKAIILIGRHPDCDVILLDSRKVSRRHCCVAQVDSTFIIRDLGSMNGVRVNGAPVRESKMREGDEVVIGDARFKFASQLKHAKLDRPAKAPPPAAAAPKAAPRPAVAAAAPPPKHKSKRPVAAIPSEAYPVAIPDEDALGRETPDQIPVTQESDEFVDPAHPEILKLDSGEIELREMSDSGVSAG